MKTKTIDEILENVDSFESLLGKCMLFNEDSVYYKFSGVVTAALLNREQDGKISILAIDTRKPGGLITFRWTKDDLRKMFSNCIEVVGNSEEESFKFV